MILSLLLGIIKHSQNIQSNKFAISLQYLKKEVREFIFFACNEHQSFYKLGLLFLMEVPRYFQSAQSRKLVIFLQRVLQLLLCYIVMQDIQLFYRGQAIFIVTCFLAQSDCRNVLPKHRNTIIKQQLCGEGLPSLLLCSKLVFFKRSRVYCSKSSYAHQKTKKNLYQALWHKYFHPKLYKNVPPYCNWKSISSMWLDTHLSRSALSIWLCSFFHLSAMQHLWMFCFFPWSFTSWSKKSDRSQFFKISSDGLE